MNNELIVSIDPKSTTAEAFKTIRTNLQFSSVDEKVKSILNDANNDEVNNKKMKM